MNVTTTLDPTRAEAFGAWIEEEAQHMASCSPTLGRPVVGIQWYLDHGYTLYLFEDDARTVHGYALVNDAGHIPALFAHDDDDLAEFTRQLIPMLVEQHGGCYGEVENERVRKVIFDALEPIVEHGTRLYSSAELRDEHLGQTP